MASEIQIISWQLTRRCNLECEYCFTSSLPSLNTSAELSTDECFSALKQLKHTPGISEDAMLVLTGGEALLRKDIYAIIQKASKAGFYVVLGTNGSTLTEENIKKLRHGVNGISVNIDYVDISPEFPRLRRAVESKLSAVQLLSKKKFPFIVNTTIHKKNIDQLSAIAELAVQNHAHSLNFFSLVPTGRGSDVYDTTQSDYNNAMKKVIEIQKHYGGKIKIKTKCAPHISAYLFNENPQAIRMFSGSGGCPAAKGYLCISPEGEILPCPYFPKNVSAGNVRKITIEKALQSKIFSDLNKRNLNGNCGKCEFSYLCSGCRARAYILGNDYLGWDPLCSYEPKGGQKITEEIIIGKGGTVYNYHRSNSTGNKEITWTAEAAERLKRIPPFVRSFVKDKIETRAKAKDITLITPEWMDAIRSQIKPGIFGGHPQYLKKETQKNL